MNTWDNPKETVTAVAMQPISHVDNGYKVSVTLTRMPTGHTRTVFVDYFSTDHIQVESDELMGLTFMKASELIQKRKLKYFQLESLILKGVQK